MQYLYVLVQGLLIFVGQKGKVKLAIDELAKLDNNNININNRVLTYYINPFQRSLFNEQNRLNKLLQQALVDKSGKQIQQISRVATIKAVSVIDDIHYIQSMIYPIKVPKIKIDTFEQSAYLPYPHQGFNTMVNAKIKKQECNKQEDIFSIQVEQKPYRKQLEKLIGMIQYGKYCITSSSGCGSTSTILHTLKTNDHLVVCDDVYGGTQGYMRKFARDNYGLQFDFIDMTKIDCFRNALKSNTKMVWIESPTNPTMKIVDINQLIKITKQNNKDIIIVVDNTFATPYLQSPLLLGADISYNSCTKYLGGHSDVVMGAIITNNYQLYSKLEDAHRCVGVNSSSFQCQLVLIGLKTLKERVIKSTSNAYHIAHYLLNHPQIDSVLYPGLTIHPQHQIAKKQMRGYGSMMSFRIKGGKQQASKFLKALKIIIFGESLGGVHSLAKLPAFMNHKVFLEEKIKLEGLTQNLIRLSVGIESLDDLIMDLQNALSSLK